MIFTHYSVRLLTYISRGVYTGPGFFLHELPTGSHQTSLMLNPGGKAPLIAT